MANTPVEVKRVPSTPARVPDALRWFRSDMDRVFDRFAAAFGMPSLPRMLDTAPAFGFESAITLPSPAVDIAEDAAAYRLSAELPGMSEHDVSVALSGDTLTIKGEKRQESEKKDVNYYLTERTWGAFERSFALPQDVDRDKVGATFAKGVLTVTLPRTAQAQQQRKQIEIKAAG
jgi:HSP20 family protein